MAAKDIIEINVGGELFTTNIQTLTKYSDSLLAIMFDHVDEGRSPMSKTENGVYFLDADPVYFRTILNFLRLGKLPFDRSK